jgi:hypothetical protein
MKSRRVAPLLIPVALALLLMPLAGEAHPTGKVHRIGFLRHFACPDRFGLKDLRQRLGEPGRGEPGTGWART